jgi:hypothetical protein
VIKEIREDINFIKTHTLQPKWWKILKIFILLGVMLGILLFFGFLKMIIWTSIFVFLGLIVHMIYRVKTKNFKMTWMDFKVKIKNGKYVYDRIGLLYYMLVIFIFVISTLAIILV